MGTSGARASSSGGLSSWFPDHGIELDVALLMRCFLDQLSDFNEERQLNEVFSALF